MGLVLDEEHAPGMDTRRSALFLKNLVTLLDFPELAEHVEEGTTASRPSLDAESLPPARLHWQIQGFGTGLRDHGLTREQCLPALRTASEDGTAA